MLDGAGRSAEAVDRYDAALALAQQLGDRRTEGQFLGHQAVALARGGRLEEADAALAKAQALLLSQGDPVSRGLLCAQRAEVAGLAGDIQRAKTALDEATTLAESAQAGPESELGKAIARLREALL